MFLDDKPQGKPGERDTGPKVLKLSEANVKRHHFQRLNDLIAAAGRRRITYKELIA